MTTLDHLTAIEERARKATPGPWSSTLAFTFKSYSVDTQMAHDPHNITYDVHKEEDADFIAAARSDLPKTCEALRRAMEYVSHARKAELEADLAAILSRPLPRPETVGPDWNNCDHEWVKIDAQDLSVDFGSVVCKKCRCPGEMTWKTRKVTWPAT